MVDMFFLSRFSSKSCDSTAMDLHRNTWHTHDGSINRYTELLWKYALSPSDELPRCFPSWKVWPTASFDWQNRALVSDTAIWCYEAPNAALRRLHYVKSLIALEERFQKETMSRNPCRLGLDTWYT